MKLQIVAAVLLISLLCPKESISAPAPVDEAPGKADHEVPKKDDQDVPKKNDPEVPKKHLSFFEQFKEQIKVLVLQIIPMLNKIKDTVATDEKTDVIQIEADIKELEQLLISLGKGGLEQTLIQVEKIVMLLKQIMSQVEDLKKTTSGYVLTDLNEITDDLKEMKEAVTNVIQQLIKKFESILVEDTATTSVVVRKKRSPVFGLLTTLKDLLPLRKKRSPLVDLTKTLPVPVNLGGVVPNGLPVDGLLNSAVDNLAGITNGILRGLAGPSLRV